MLFPDEPIPATCLGSADMTVVVAGGITLAIAAPWKKAISR